MADEEEAPAEEGAEEEADNDGEDGEEEDEENEDAVKAADAKNKRIVVFKNGDCASSIIFTVAAIRWNELLHDMTYSLHASFGCVLNVYEAVSGRKITRVTDLMEDIDYVGCGSEKLKKLDYKQRFPRYVAIYPKPIVPPPPPPPPKQIPMKLLRPICTCWKCLNLLNRSKIEKSKCPMACDNWRRPDVLKRKQKKAQKNKVCSCCL